MELDCLGARDSRIFVPWLDAPTFVIPLNCFSMMCLSNAAAIEDPWLKPEGPELAVSNGELLGGENCCIGKEIPLWEGKEDGIVEVGP